MTLDELNAAYSELAVNLGKNLPRLLVDGVSMELFRVTPFYIRTDEGGNSTGLVSTCVILIASTFKPHGISDEETSENHGIWRTYFAAQVPPPPSWEKSKLNARQLAFELLKQIGEGMLDEFEKRGITARTFGQDRSFLYVPPWIQEAYDKALGRR